MVSYLKSLKLNPLSGYWVTPLMVLGVMALLTTMTLLQLGVVAVPTPSVLIELWEHGFQPELIASLVAITLMGGMMKAWRCGGVARWCVEQAVLLCFITSLAIVAGLWWFSYQTGLPISKQPWTIVTTYTVLSKNAAMAALYLQTLGISFFIALIITVSLIALCHHRDTTLGDARFANPWDIQRAKLYAKEGVFLGKAYGKFLILGGYESVLVVAPTGSGKSSAVGVPNLLRWQGSVVVNDLKGELYQLTQAYRTNTLKQHCYCFAPGGGSGDTHRYNPFAYVRVGQAEYLKDLQFIANILIQKANNEPAFWPINSRELFVMCALYCFDMGKRCTLSKVHELARREDFLDWLIYESEARHIKEPLFYQYASSFVQCEEKTRGNILKDFHARIELFADPIICEATNDNDFDIRQLRKQGMSIYLHIPDSEKERLSPIITLFYAQLIALLSQALPDKQQEPKDVLLLLDEFGNMGKIPQLKSGLSFLRSYRIRAIMMVQYLGQIVSVYGQTDAKAFTNCKVKMAFTLNDVDDAQFFAKALGQRTIKVRQRSTSSQQDNYGGSVSHTTQLKDHWLMSPDKLMRLSIDKSIILIEGSYPIHARKKYYF